MQHILPIDGWHQVFRLQVPEQNGPDGDNFNPVESSQLQRTVGAGGVDPPGPGVFQRREQLLTSFSDKFGKQINGRLSAAAGCQNHRFFPTQDLQCFPEDRAVILHQRAARPEDRSAVRYAQQKRGKGCRLLQAHARQSAFAAHDSASFVSEALADWRSS